MEHLKIEILLIEDNLPEADLIKEMLLETSKQGFVVNHVQYLAEGLNQLGSRNFDCVLVDLGLPDSQGLETALAVRVNSKQTPVVVLTVLDDEETALKSLQMDIQDYLLKEEINGRLLIRSIRYAIQRKRDIEALRFSEARYRALFRDNPTLILTLDAELTMLSVNPTCACMLGYMIEELEGRSVLEIFHEDDRAAVAEQLRKCLQNPHQVQRWQLRKTHKDGSLLWVEEIAQAVYDLNGNPNVLVVCQDITERKRIEEALQESEERFRATFNQAAVGIGHVTPDGRWLRINQKYCDIVGYTEEEFKTLTIKDITHPDDLETSMQHFQLLLEGKLGNYSLGKRYIRKDGSTVWVNLTASMVFDAGGNPSFAVGVVEDITDRKRVEELLRLENNLTDTVINSMPGIFYVYDDQEKLIRWNKRLEDFSGHSPEGMPTLRPHDFVAEENHGLLEPKLREVFVEHRNADIELLLLDREGRKIPFYCTGSPMIVGDKTYLVGLGINITERKRAEEEIKRLNASLTARAAELEDLNRELETFNYTVAHDLRQPLNVISSYCQVIKELCGDNLDEQCKGYLHGSYEGTLRMNRLIEALLNFSRMGHVEPRRDMVDLSAMAHEVILVLKLTEPERQVEFRIAAGISADGDSNLLRVVLENLLGNAWKYTTTREEAVIEFGTTDIDGQPVCFVRDNGNGFKMVDADKLFAPFQRLPGAEERKGFGIGLATVERIIRRHGGKIWAEGEPDKGATFYFTLPQ